MAVALPGVTTSFVLSTSAPTLLSPARADPSGRFYFRIDNVDKKNAVAFAVGTNNGALPQHHLIPPGSYYEFKWQSPAGGPLPQPSWGPQGDISAIAVSAIGGNPSISYLEI